MTSLQNELEKLLASLPEGQRESIAQAVRPVFKGQVWLPNAGPQTMAFESEADELFYGGCVSGDTEYLSPTGWRRIDQYDGGEVAQWEPGEALTWCKPDGYTDAPCNSLIEFKNSRISMLLSPGHRMALYDYQGKFVVKAAADVATAASRHIIPTTFSPVRPGLPLTEAEIRLAVAIHADGNLEPRKKTKDWRCRFTLRKTRKIERLTAMLTAADIKWHTYRNQNRPTEIRMEFITHLGTKRYAGDWWQCSAEQLAVILDEMSYWDGNISGTNGGDIVFSSAHRCDVDFMQYVAHACGRYATIGLQKHGIYRVNISHPGSVKGRASLRCDAISIKTVPANRMYCFTVPTSFWLARHAGGCFVTGNSAGGGKTDLLIGAALSSHRRSLILRRLNGEVEGLIDRAVEIVGHSRGLKRSAPARWKFAEQIIMFGGCQHIEDKEKYRGNPKDLIAFDEITAFLRPQYEFIIGWARSTVKGQRVRVIAAGNPPTSAEGMWVIERWAPWLDPNHPNPALPGELRYFTTYEGRDFEVDGPGPVVINGVPLLDERGAQVFPKSRTFIPASLDDNPDLAETGYADTISGMPEELRRALKGDFSVSHQDADFQLFKTAHIEAAMERWTEAGRDKPMDAIAADIAQGGIDRTAISRRHGTWFDHILTWPGKDTPTGAVVAGLIIMNRRNGAEIIIDMGGGYGGSTRDHLVISEDDPSLTQIKPTLYSGAMTAEAMKDRTGMLRFYNLRAAACWSLAEKLDPAHGSNLALPPDPELKAELAAFRWETRPGSKIFVKSKDEIKKELGRSPDKADALIMAAYARGKTTANYNAISGSMTRAITSGRKPRR